MAFGRYGIKKIFRHPKKLQSFLEDNVAPPIYVRIKPTNKCNHHCYYCAYDLNSPIKIDRTAELPREKMMEILSDFKDMEVKAVTYSGGGEPLIYPHIVETMRKTLDYGIDLSIITNGQSLDGKKADILTQAKWVRISADSSDAKTFSEIRKVPENWFHKLTDNIETFAGIKSLECVLGINFIVQEKNFDKIYDSIKFFRDLGVDNIKLTPRHLTKGTEEYHKKFKKTAIEQIKEAKKSFPDFEIYDTYDIDFSAVGIPERKYGRCYMMQTVPAISALGLVYPCHDKAWMGVDSLGSIKNQSFKELWFSEETKRKFREFNPQEMCKHHCTNDLKNMQINKFLREYSEEGKLEISKRISPIHVNFV